MKQEIKEEALEQLKKDIIFGFDGKRDLKQGIKDMFYDEDDFDKKWLKEEIKTRLKNHKEESKNWNKPTDFDKLVNAFDTLIKNGIVALHKAGYTKQDGESDGFELINKLKKIAVNAKGFCYYHTQDLERAISQENNLFIGFDSYNQNDNLALEIGKEIVATLQLNGFKVKWNETINTRIEITKIHWQKTVDKIDYNYDRIFDLMQKHFK